jgi:hypothetical protein
MVKTYLAAAATPGFRVIALIITVVMACVLTNQGSPLRNQHAHGIISLELAWTGTRAQEVVDAWKSDRLKRTAYWQVLLDFIFIVGYASGLVALALVTQRGANAAGLTCVAYFAGLGVYGGIAAGILDCLENCGMLVMLSGCINTPIALITSVCAFTKFALIGLVVLTGLAAFLFA